MRRPVHASATVASSGSPSARGWPAPATRSWPTSTTSTALYEGVIVRAIAHPIARAANWVNQNIIDAHRQRRRASRAQGSAAVFYRDIDQRVVDGAVNGSGAVATGTGSALRPVQSGKVSQYGALLFGAAAVGAIVLVIVNV